MSVTSQLNALRDEMSDDVKIVAVSKFHPAEMIREAYDAGQRIFGESRVQELVAKYDELPKDIEWHFIGSLQRNKVKFIAPFISLIHSMDSERLMLEIEKQGAISQRIIQCLLEIRVADEDTKSGFTPDECRNFLENGKWRECPHVQFIGVMGMATFTEDKEQIRTEFTQIKTLFTEFKNKYFANNDSFKEISMGMTSDYPVAIEEGSTMIRVGTLIFGNR
ncbi:MAG: YggS family pyridoxal phosphate-dependent enzyme [Dysgonamonadaceae bacterium]